jgi:two-component system NarL family sensor kinase
VSTLHPQVLVQVGLSAAVRDVAERYEQRWGTTVHADIAEVGRPEAQTLIYRAARELLTNAHKHSRATQLGIALDRRNGGTALRVTDNGIGFDPEILARRVTEGHIGLASLIVAVEAAGGSVDFGERPGGGTIVTVTVPDELVEEGMVLA